MFAQSRSTAVPHRRSTRHIRAALIVLILATLIVIAAHARGWLTSRPAASSSAFASASFGQQQETRQRSRMEAEIITITPLGFEPLEIMRPAGRFILVVDNRSGLDDVTLRLDLETGQRQQEVRIPREHPDWDSVVDLHPGTYLVTEASHPDWLCRITITAQ